MKQLIIFIDPSVYDIRAFQQDLKDVEGIIVPARPRSWGLINPIQIYDLNNLSQTDIYGLTELVHAYLNPSEPKS